jgi:hypothetical protein
MPPEVLLAISAFWTQGKARELQHTNRAFNEVPHIEPCNFNLIASAFRRFAGNHRHPHYGYNHSDYYKREEATKL